MACIVFLLDKASLSGFQEPSLLVCQNLAPYELVNGSFPNLFAFIIQDSKELSLLESNKKRKGRLKTKGSRRKEEDLREVDGEIEAALQKKGAMRVLWVVGAVFA